MTKTKLSRAEKVTKAELESTFTSNTLVGPDNDLIRLANLYCFENKIIGGQKTVQVRPYAKLEISRRHRSLQHLSFI